MKKHWKPALILAAALLLAWGLWYSRPVDVYTLASGMREPDTMDFTLWELGEGGRRYPLKDFSPEDPEWNAALKAVEALRFRRPPWNAILQFVSKRAVTGRTTHDGALHIMFSIGQQRAGSVQIQFFIDEWVYSSPHANRNLTLWVTSPRESGNALAETLRPLLEEE